MDTRKVSPAIRRRVGQPTCNYTHSHTGGVIKALPMGTDWPAIEAAFAAKPGVAVDPRIHAGLSPVTETTEV